MKHFKLFCLIIFLIAGFSTYGQKTFIGSENYGRLFNIQYDSSTPNKLYALSLGNHIVTSNDNGETWELLFSFDNSKATCKGLKLLGNTNKLSFYSANTLYILDINTGQISWSSSLPIPQQAVAPWVTSYAVSPDNSQVIIASQSFKNGPELVYSKAYYTTDGGQNWQEIYYSADNNNIQLNSVAITPGNSDKIFLLRGQGPDGVIGGLLISQDAGGSWQEELAGYTLKAYDFNPSNSQEMLIGTAIGFGAHDEKLFKTTDGGNSWDSIPISWSDMTLDNITDIHYNPTAPDTILVLEENEVVISTDGFMTWDNYVYSNADTHSYYYGLNSSFNPFQKGEVFVSSNFYALFSSNNGKDLEWAKNPYFNVRSNVYVSQNNTQKHLYYGVQFGYVHKNLITDSIDSHFIKPIGVFSTDPTTPMHIDEKIPGRVYIFKTGMMGQRELVASANHGANYTSIYRSFKSDLDAAVSYPTQTKRIIIALSNEGASPELIQIDYSDTTQITTTDLTLPVDERVTGMYLDNVGDTLIISLGAHIYRSADNGQTWEESTDGLETLMPNTDQIFDLSFNPLHPNQLAIATSKGLFLSADLGETWTQIKEGFYNQIEFSPVTNGHLIATRYSAQHYEYELFYSGDMGENWGNITVDELYYIQSSSSETLFNDDGKTAEVFIGTADLGVLKAEIDFNSLGVPNHTAPKNWLTLYPNPVVTNLHLQLNHQEDIKSTAIYDINGVLIQQNRASEVLNVSALSPGIYFIQVNTTDNQQTVKRFIKR